MRIGETIKEVRLKAGMTQVEFAKILGSSQAAISECENGTKTPSLKFSQKIVKFAKSKKMKLTLDDIFQDE